MARLPYPDLERVAPARLAILGYPANRLLNITRIALHMPEKLWRGHIALKQAMTRDTTMDLVLREVLIMRVAHNARCDYELHHHISISANLGFSLQKQDAIARQDYAALTEDERAVAIFTDETCKLSVSDKTLATVRAMFGDALVMEMAAIIASYWGTAMMVAVTGVEPDEEPVRNWATAQGGSEED
ncbi:carboxymuconolactone decarboxylase family protein [Sphingobium nicotianae]|uniref:Carboxymuconolactone decarboxylase family protein n=1 Tax=Sphingobium nicotianae TaxID=2782607 RepID=A0A9X1DDN4_9SPHN|nr:carboxymuconolactone decarboxylase family protein [Sphingobium nicotianae]MBT2188305.1 carboxymuconolactone decarboxylase family protein [Sphingobium nicotianae]